MKSPPLQRPATPADSEDRKLRVLQSTTPFDSLDRPLLRRAHAASEWLHLSRRSALPVPSIALLCIASGQVRVIRKGESRDVLLRFHGPGELVGVSVVLGRRSAADWLEVGPEADLEAVHVPASVVRAIAERDARFAIALGHLVAELLAQIEDRLALNHECDVVASVGWLLLRLAERYGTQDPDGRLHLQWRPTHREMARWVGATRETVTHALSRLRRRGLVVLRDRGYELPKPKLLARVL